MEKREKFHNGKSITGEDGHVGPYCCISHSFFSSSKINLHKVALIQVATSKSAGQDLPRKLKTATPPLAYQGDRVFTYADILCAVQFLSSRILSTGHPLPEKIECNGSEYVPKVVGLLMHPSPEYIVSVLSVLRIGCAFLPIDPSWSKEKLSFIISVSRPYLVITYCASFSWISQLCSCDVMFFSIEELIEHENGGINDMVWPCEMQTKRMFCYLMYTSGSTGQPKGVCGTEEGLMNRFLWMHGLFPFSSNDVLLFKTPTSFVDHLQEFFSALLSGCTLVVAPFNELKENPSSLVSFIQDYLIDRVTVIPSVARAILPALKMRLNKEIKSSLNIIVLSGEVFSLSLWDSLTDILPNTSIINLYGSTEVSGDCTFFDCKRLPQILEKESISSVPIGVPISNCQVILASGTDNPNEGEIIVSGICLSCGYFSEGSVIPFDTSNPFNIATEPHYYRTGDRGRKLKSGDLVYLGRNDRIIKVNGQRLALEEIEDVLRSHSNVADVAVVFHEKDHSRPFIEAFVLPKNQHKFSDAENSIRRWMVDRVQLAMVPNRFVFVESLPLTSSGKVDYPLLSSSDTFVKTDNHKRSSSSHDNLMQTIKEAFRDALATHESFNDDDDFFAKGGNSLGAAHASYNLKINIKKLYEFPTPSKLCNAISNKVDIIDTNMEPKGVKIDDRIYNIKRLKADVDNIDPLRGFSPCSFNRGNQLSYGHELSSKTTLPIFRPRDLDKDNLSVNEVWKIHMESCVDASPLLVFKNEDLFLFIGSHSRRFLCAYAISGVVKWETTLEGRIECTASIVDDFSQIVVGCYKGRIYFLDFENGQTIWAFQTYGEVKCQPMIDKSRHLVWCGSHDHNLYALDYKNKRCIYALECGGSVFGSPAIDEERNILFVGSTSGRISALLLKMNELEEPSFNISWKCELEAPIFASLIVSPTLEMVICCSVDGHIVALNTKGSLVWKIEVGGPVFAGPCCSRTLPFQVLVCTRNGRICSIDMERGWCLWEHHVEQPISGSAYVDEWVWSGRLICVCTSSGRMHFVSVKSRDDWLEVEEIAKWDLPGEVFSSPLAVNGHVFVGCRDNFIRCITLASQ